MVEQLESCWTLEYLLELCVFRDPRFPLHFLEFLWPKSMSMSLRDMDKNKCANYSERKGMKRKQHGEAGILSIDI